MKMEVLSAVQNHQYQGQFGVIGSTKVKDWTSPLTPPPPPPPINQSNHHPPNRSSQQQQQQQHQQQQQEHHNQQQKHNGSNSNNTTTAGHNNTQINADVVDGREPSHTQYQHYYRNQHQARHYQPPAANAYSQQVATAMEAAAVAIEGSTATAGTARYAYNNNLLYCDAMSSVASTPTTPEVASVAADLTLHTRFGAASDDIDDAAVADLSQRLQAELRAAKSRHLACTEVSLPWDLTPRIAVEIIRTSEREPCGVRGCTIFIEFEDEPNNTRRIASFKVDPNTVSTFELYLTLKNDKSGWTSKLPQFLKNLTRSSTIQISPDFTLTKNKLYSCE